jgi:antitoxin VapB
MTLSIRNPEADILAKKLAIFENTNVTDAVIIAIKARLKEHLKKETPTETAERIAKEMGLTLNPNRKPVPPETYHEFDHTYFEDDDDVR